MIHVIDVQSRATIQDLGRFGLRRFGISHCGAMDKLALRAGNILLGNAEGAPAIRSAFKWHYIAISSRYEFLCHGGIL